MKKITCFLVVLICTLFISTFSFADSVTLPDNLVEIEEEAFFNDRNIREVIISEGTRTIGRSAFAYSGLHIIYIPETVNYIDPSAFEGLMDSFIIFSPENSYGHQFAVDNHFHWLDSAYNDFLLWMLSSTDTNGNHLFDEDEITAVTTIDCAGLGFTSIDGVELFNNLQSLYCRNNQLTQLDVSINHELKHLNCAGNQLSSLDISNNSKLVSLVCGDSVMDGTPYGVPYGNYITHLDVSNNPLLQVLWCPHNELTELDVSHNPELLQLGCFDNQIGTMNTSMNLKLQRLLSGENPLGVIDVSHNTELWQFNCYDNSLTSLDLNNNTKLTFLWCNDNHLTSIDLNNQTQLQTLNCSSNELMNLDVSSNSALESLNCINNQLTSLNVSSNPNLKTLNCANNQLTGINLQSCTALKELNCNANALTTLDISNNSDLQFLNCWHNNISGMNLSYNGALIKVNLSANHELTSISLGNMQNLEMLWVQNTGLSQLDIRNAPIILDAYWNGTRMEFNGDGTLSEYGSFYGFQLGEGLNLGSSREIEHCSLCIDKTTAVLA